MKIFKINKDKETEVSLPDNCSLKINFSPTNWMYDNQGNIHTGDKKGLLILSGKDGIMPDLQKSDIGTIFRIESDLRVVGKSTNCVKNSIKKWDDKEQEWLYENISEEAKDPSEKMSFLSCYYGLLQKIDINQTEDLETIWHITFELKDQ